MAKDVDKKTEEADKETVGSGDFRKGGFDGGSFSRIDRPIQDETGPLIKRLQTRVDNWGESVSIRITQRVADHLESSLARQTDLGRSYELISIEVPMKRVNGEILPKIKKYIGSWLKENGIDYHFLKEVVNDSYSSYAFTKRGTLGRRGWEIESFIEDTGSVKEYDYYEEGPITSWRVSGRRDREPKQIEIEEDWIPFALKEVASRHENENSEFYLLLLHWNLER